LFLSSPASKTPARDVSGTEGARHKSDKLERKTGLEVFVADGHDPAASSLI